MPSLLGQSLNIPNLRVGRSKTTNGQPVRMQFPSNLGDYFIILNFKQYDYSTAQSNSQGRLSDSIALPLPANLVDSSRIEVGGKQIGTTGQLAASSYDMIADQLGKMNITGTEDFLNALGTGVKAGLGAAGQGVKAGYDLFDQNGAFGGMDAIAAQFSGVGAMTTYAIRGFADKLAPGVGQGLGAAIGNTLNPHATLVFDGVDLKIHNFDWTFAPRNESESDQLAKIIEKIQYHIHPEYKSGTSQETGFTPIDRGLLSYPSLLEIILVCPSDKINFMVKFNKYVMVNQFNVDYTPNGIALNRGGRPAVIRCSMNVTESQIRTKGDYAGGAPASNGPLERDTTAGEPDQLQQNRAQQTPEGEPVSPQGQSSSIPETSATPPAADPLFPAPGALATEAQSAILRERNVNNYPLPGEPLSTNDVAQLDIDQYDPSSDPEINEGA